MDRCNCDWASVFDARAAEGDLRRYRERGPDRTTRLLLDLVRPYVATGSTVLDVGGGVGVIDHELLRAGAGRAVLVDASRAYLDAARQEAGRQHALDRIELVEGDFTQLAGRIDAADIVTLDRVVCCYRDAESLVALSVARARRAYGLVLPRNRTLTGLALRVENAWNRLRAVAYRAYVHSNTRIDALAAARGFMPRAERTTLFWRVVVYARPDGPSAASG